jgi:TolB-like protein/class 3 adenylate cyclase
MSRDHLSGKLAVILHADVASSTALVQQDKELAHERIQDAFRRFGDSIEKYKGHVLELRGDALLAEFEHAADAVSAALSFQVDHTHYTNQIEDDIKPEIRVGISMGEVVVADNTVTGAGVVQAQRIEQLANPGSVYITATIHEALSKRLPFVMENLGEQRLKGFEHPVHVYRISLKSGASVPLPEPVEPVQKPIRHWKVIGISALMLALITSASIYWFRSTKSTGEILPEEQAEIALPDKPSIAVLPFTNMSSEAEQDYFADGMTEDLITDLSKISGLFVISRNSVFTYKGKPVKIQQVAEELGVRYVLEGSIRKVGHQVRINTQLIDSITGGHIWAERYDGTYEDVFRLQDKVTSKIVTTLAVKLAEGEQDQISKIETNNTEAYDTFLKGWEQYLRQTPESFLQAITLFEKAVELDPEYSRAYAALSLTYWQGWKSYWHSKLGHISPHEIRFEAEKYLGKAMKEPTSLALQISTSMLAQHGQHDEAITQGERAIVLDPNNPDGYVALAGALNLAGYPEKSLPLMERALRLNPYYPTSYLYELGLARFGLQEYDAAVVALQQAVTLNPTDRWSSRLLIATLGHLDRADEAVAIIDRIKESWRGFDPLSVHSIAFWYPFKEPVDAERLAEGLRKAGLPD